MTIHLTVTDKACDYLKKIIEKEQGLGFRLSIKKTGCSGYSYAPSVVRTPLASDECIVANGVTIYVDSAWANLLNGLHIDYIEDEKSGLKQKRLAYSNPQEAARCGCGESFVTKNESE